MKILKYTFRFIIFLLLTVLTQIGGIIYLLNFFTYRITDGYIKERWAQRSLHFISFLLLYCLATFLIVPLLAKPFGRVPMPVRTTNHLKPLTVFTCLLNRNYVKPELRTVALTVAEEMNRKYPGTTTFYLDGNFPFVTHFPLLPHLSHHDGKKLDLSFYYNNAKTGESINEVPSPIGYGICEEPLGNEVNTAAFCEQKGYWQYSWLKKIIPQNYKTAYVFDQLKTKLLVQLILDQSLIGKVFIEPHLCQRMNLNNEKIRFHGCQAVRHDDHIHIQLK